MCLYLFISNIFFFSVILSWAICKGNSPHYQQGIQDPHGVSEYVALNPICTIFFAECTYMWQNLICKLGTSSVRYKIRDQQQLIIKLYIHRHILQ
jgi:hypothetical protein